jgi:hypothetical protein
MRVAAYEAQLSADPLIGSLGAPTDVEKQQRSVPVHQRA